MQVERAGDAWDLAAFASRNVEEPYNTLEKVFQDEIFQLEQEDSSLPISVKNSIHSIIMSPRKESLKQKITELYQREINRLFTEKEIQELVAEVKQHDCFMKLKYLFHAVSLSQIESYVFEQPLINKEEIVKEIRNAVKMQKISN